MWLEDKLSWNGFSHFNLLRLWRLNFKNADEVLATLLLRSPHRIIPPKMIRVKKYWGIEKNASHQTMWQFGLCQRTMWNRSTPEKKIEFNFECWPISEAAEREHTIDFFVSWSTLIRFSMFSNTRRYFVSSMLAQSAHGCTKTPLSRWKTFC